MTYVNLKAVFSCG